MTGKERAIRALNRQNTDRTILFGDIEDLKILHLCEAMATQDDPRKRYTECCKRLGIGITRGYSANFEIGRYDKSKIKEIRDTSKLMKILSSYDKDQELKELFETVGKDVEYTGDELLILPQIKWSILGDLVYALGYEELATGVLEEDLAIIELIECLTRNALEDITILSGLGDLPAILYMDDIAYDDGLLYHPDSLRKYFFPNLERMADHSRSFNFKLIYHSHGDITPILSEILKTRIDGLLPLGRSSFEKLKKNLPEEFLLIPDIDPGESYFSSGAIE